MYPVTSICEIVHGSFLQKAGEADILHLVYDSRRLQQAGASLFFALLTEHNDGHKFIEDAYKKGVRNFIVSREVSLQPDSNIILVKNTLDALQKLAAHHRSRFSIPVIGITGSNGKTIVKEWLYQLLQDDFNIIRSPRSFNSQLGVPLSVWQMNEQHSLAIFEAGISKTGEMHKLENIIRPTIGILTNIGEAHDEGFPCKKIKEEEKARLFINAGMVIFPGDELQVIRDMCIHPGQDSERKPFLKFSWGKQEHNQFHVTGIQSQYGNSRIEGIVGGKSFSVTIPFTDGASVENAITCCCVMLAMGYDEATIRQRLSKLHAIDMRLQLKHSFNECIVINDSYSADITSLKIALDFQKQQATGLKHTVILSEFVESGTKDAQLYQQIAELLAVYHINKVIVVGEKIFEGLKELLTPEVEIHAFPSTDDFINVFRSSQFFREIILIKGARKFGFERVARLFEEKKHQTVLEINLNALAHNLKEYHRILKPGTRIMAMVKAFSYGSGGAEIASVLQYHHVDYLGVAYADEGVDLVKAGISLPVMVMNAESSSFQSIVDYNLQPVIYSMELLKSFESYIRDQGLSSYPVHLEMDTGMNRLGFPVDEIENVARHIRNSGSFYIISVFSHLAASEDEQHDAFTQHQATIFDEGISMIKKSIDYPFLEHISNSAAVVRHPHLQKDMVRLGIGLYGIEVDNANMLDLQAVATLRSTIAQLRKVKKGDSVSYNRRGVMQKDSIIATVRIGYADGYSRHFGNGAGKMLVAGQLVPVTGVVCMDMTMIDVSDVKGVKEGDDVIIFGPGLPVQQVAKWANTIPYELMTAVSQRVKRIYFHE